jgi:phosphoglucomutase
MADFYKSQKINLLEFLKKIHERYGFYKEISFSEQFIGFEQIKKIENFMNNLRKNKLKEICGIKIKELIDYKNGYKDYEKSDVLYFILKDNSWFCIRPSGTEPKLKFYIGANDKIENNVDIKLKKMVDYIKKMIKENF